MPNRLAWETSPYLLQHAGNPVDWYPWGEEARERAREEDRPILLSIGYSACHWCHVMEKESFEDGEVAGLMNASFVNIKVDREERPDLDQVYMRAVQAMTGQGGWPLTAFLTPRGEPYYGGTYFPPVPRHGMPSFRQVLGAAAAAWRDRPEEVRRGAAHLIDALARATSDATSAEGGEREPESGAALLDHASTTLARQFDARHGGFGSAPKFPQPVTLELLLRQHLRTGAPEPRKMTLHTLRRMAAGGIRDHLGGGFHRYSVDARWLVPHFEKMLYDNALLAGVYLDAYRLCGDDDLKAVAEHTLDYLLADLRSPEGAFFAARDADSEGEEGRYYVWTPAEVERVVGPADARLFMRAYDVAPGGNFEGRSILWHPHDPAVVARSEGLDEAELEARLAPARAALLAVRAQREPPLRDEKILVGWNGLTLRVFAEAGVALGRLDYVEAATRGARFLLDELRIGGRLMHTWKDGQARVLGFLEDHAALGNALVSLHEATLDPRWLAEARWTCDEILSLYWDGREGCFYDAPSDGEVLFMRARDTMDNATPSGNSLAAELLLRAGHLFDEGRYHEIVERVLAREADSMKRFPTAFGRLLCVLDRSLAPPREVAIVGAPGDEGTRALLAATWERLHRNLAVTGRAPGEVVPGVPLLDARDQVDGRPTAYLCERYACRAPTTDPVALRTALAESVRA